MPSGNAAPAFRAVAPAQLALGPGPVDRSAPIADRVGVLERNGNGLESLLAEAPTREPVVVHGGIGATRSMVVAGGQSLVLSDPRPDAEAALFWERERVSFELLVVA